MFDKLKKDKVLFCLGLVLTLIILIFSFSFFVSATNTKFDSFSEANNNQANTPNNYGISQQADTNPNNGASTSKITSKIASTKAPTNTLKKQEKPRIIYLVSECESINTSGNYSLTQDLSSNGTCIIINSNDVILNCQGHSITGNLTFTGGLGTGSGILVNNSDNVSIKNCNITHYVDAIKLQNVNNSIIFNNNLSWNGRAGTFLNLSNYTNVSNNNASYNFHYRIDTHGSHCDQNGMGYNLSNDSMYCGEGFFLLNSSHNTLERNYHESYHQIIYKDNFTYQAESGIALWYSNYNVLNNNTIISPHLYGFKIFGSSNNSITHNKENGHYQSDTLMSTNDGIILESSYQAINASVDVPSLHNNITNNTFNNNSEWGVWLQRANYTLVKNNSVNNNHLVGIRIGPGSGHNQIYGNNMIYPLLNPDSTGIRVEGDFNVIENNTAINHFYGLKLGEYGGDFPSDNVINYNNFSFNEFGVDFFISNARDNLNTSIKDVISVNNSDSGLTNYRGFTDYPRLENVTIENCTFGGDKVDIGVKNFSFNFVDIKIDSLTNPIVINFTSNEVLSVDRISSPASDPADYKNMSKYMNITNNSNDSWMNISMSYNDSDWQNARIRNESSLTFLRYNGTKWVSVPNVFVNTTSNIVYSNISGSNFGKIGVFGDYPDNRRVLPPIHFV